MFACIYGRNLSKSNQSAPVGSETKASPLVDLAFTFSPLVEETTADTVVFDVSGQDLLFGLPGPVSETNEIESARNIANEIYRRGKELCLKINVAIAADADVAIHTARSFAGITVVGSGEELSKLDSLPIKAIDFSLVAIEAKRAEEIQETFALWGTGTFGDLAELPLAGVAERLGQEGVRLQKLAQGKTDRRLNLVRPPIGFEQSLELEHHITELEPLSFILSRLLNQLCANLNEYALATNELRLRFVTEGCSEYRLQSGVSVASKDPTKVGTLNTSPHERTITLPVPMRNPKTLLRLLLFEIEREPPPAPIMSVAITAEPVKPRGAQSGLFVPMAPEPEKLEITLARLAKLVGPENVGSPELLDTHRPDAFRMKRFRLDQKGRRNVSKGSRIALNADETHQFTAIGFRMFRPAWRAEVQTKHGKPIRIDARSSQVSASVRGQIVCAAGPWRASGEWWRSDVWARDEWDVAVINPASQKDEVLCRIYRDLTSEQWFMAGIYD